MKKIVIIWASNNPDKFWYKITKNLLNKNHELYLVNPKGWKILWQDVYKNISEINNDFEIVNFITQPSVTIKILQDNFKILKNKTIWCQPGSTDLICENYIAENYSDYIINSCIMIEKL